MTTDIIIQYLINNYGSQRPKSEIIPHTDLGTQYTSKEFKDLTSSILLYPTKGGNKPCGGPNHKGCPYDNACIESFQSTLKKEDVYQIIYVTFEQARTALFQYIEGRVLVLVEDWVSSENEE